MRRVEVYCGLNSPWTYLAWDRLLRPAGRAGAGPVCRPIDLGAVFGRTGGLPLARRAPERR